MLRVRYRGASGSGVEILHPAPDAPEATTVTVCPPGEDVDLPDDVAVSLMAAGSFEAADKKAEAALRRYQREQANNADQDQLVAGGDVPTGQAPVLIADETVKPENEGD